MADDHLPHDSSHMMSDTMTVDSWGGGTQATSMTVPLQRDDAAGFWYCPKHPDFRSRDRSGVCPYCEEEYQNNRDSLKERQRNVQDRLQELSFESSGDFLHELHASLKNWKPTAELDSVETAPGSTTQQKQHQESQLQQHNHFVMSAALPSATQGHLNPPIIPPTQVAAPQQINHGNSHANTHGAPPSQQYGPPHPSQMPSQQNPHHLAPSAYGYPPLVEMAAAAATSAANAAAMVGGAPLPPRHPSGAPSPQTHIYPGLGGVPTPTNGAPHMSSFVAPPAHPSTPSHYHVVPPIPSSAMHMPPTLHHGSLHSSHANDNSSNNTNNHNSSSSNNNNNNSSAIPSSMDALTIQIQRMHQMQDWMLWQKDTECTSLRSRLDEAMNELQQLRVDNALLQEKLHQQEQRMQHELRLIKLAALRRRSGSSQTQNSNSNNHNNHTIPLVITGGGGGTGDGDEPSSHSHALRLMNGQHPSDASTPMNQIVVMPSPGDFMSDWVNQETQHRRPSTETQHSQEDVVESIEEPPHMSVTAGEEDDADFDFLEGAGGNGQPPQQTHPGSRSSAEPPFVMLEQPQQKQLHDMSRQSMSRQKEPTQQQTKVLSTTENFPSFLPAENYIPSLKSVGAGVVKSEDSVTTDSEECKDAFDSNSITWPTENSLGSKPRTKPSSYKHKTGPLTAAHANSLSSEDNPSHPQTRPVTEETSAPMSVPMHRENGGRDLLVSSSASVSSADLYVKEEIDEPSSPSSPSCSFHQGEENSQVGIEGSDLLYQHEILLNGSAEHDHNDDADDELEEEEIEETSQHTPSNHPKTRSYGTSLYAAHVQQQLKTTSQQQQKHRSGYFKTSPSGNSTSPSRSMSSSSTSSSTPSEGQSPPHERPRVTLMTASSVPSQGVIPSSSKVCFVDEDNTSVGHTVASSTFGEDRYNVVNQTILDPYGDKGTYTGYILRSTGMPHGSGEMLYQEDKRIYSGEWRHGRWHGFGRARFANGDSYEGEYRFDQRHGRGIYHWADGRVYDGYFREDKRHGRGKFCWPDGAIYEGDFRNGQREGQGSYIFSDGGKYEGSWRDGRYSGYGVCSWEDGRCYKGEWLNGMAHGKGVETFADGSIRHEGLWREDEPVQSSFHGKMIV